MSTAPSRTLGKRQTLGPVKPPSKSFPAPLEQFRNPELLSPSESSLSLNSQQSTSKSSNDEHDISAAVALQAKSNVAVASASSRMVCPICNEEMMTLLQLNRHLDDAHKNLENDEQDEVKDWFKTQILKAKKFQPLAVLNQKFKGLDVFESNEDRRTPSIPPPSNRPQSNRGNAEPSPQRLVDLDEIVTREHWQRLGPNNACSDPLCGRRLGGVNGNINCRKCGKLFCEEHTMYQMKLSRSAQHEPVRGHWCRVCETCFKSRDGYNDHTGIERDHLDSFKAVRRKVVDKSCLEISRLEKRLSKLTRSLVDSRLEQDLGTVAYLWSISGAKSQQRLLEETIVEWEDDQKVTRCPFCQQEFTNYSFRRHHCRLCGRVVCGDPLTECSTAVGLSVDAAQMHAAEKSKEKANVDIRMCKDCKHTLFSKSDFAHELSRATPDQRSFHNLKQFERGIRVMLPRFQKLLNALQDPEKPPTSTQLQEASKIRRRLTESFTQYDVAARRIRDIPTSSPSQARLQKQVYAQASQFLHLHMLPLKALPKILKHATPAAAAAALSNQYLTKGAGGHSRSVSNSSVATVNGHLAPESANGANRLVAIRTVTPGPEMDESSRASSTSRLSSLETEEKAAREQLIVLEEQRFLVGEMLADAQRRRKMEEVESLGRNVEDLNRECDRLAGVVEGLGREIGGVWMGDGNADGSQ